MDKLKLNIGDKVPVIRMGAVEERPTTFDGKTKIYYDNPVRVVETGNEMIWSHGSETAQQKLEAAAQVGDAVTIEYLKLDVGGCYVFHTSEQESSTPPPSGLTISPELRTWMDKVIANKNDVEKRLNGLEFGASSQEAKIDQHIRVGHTAPEAEQPTTADGYDIDDDIPF